MKNLSLILGLMIAASPAFASRARLEALGEGKNGSYYIGDARNVFLNPAHIVKYKKKMWLELGGAGTAGVDAAGRTTNVGQGGFSNTFGDFTYGLYLNNNDDNWQDTATTWGAGYVSPESTIDLFFGGEAGVNWGVNLGYAGNGTKTAGTDATATLLNLGLGVEADALQVWINANLIGSAKILNGAANGNEVKDKLSMNAGLSYAMDSWTWFGKFVSNNKDENNATVTEQRNTMYGIGGGYKHEFSKATTMFARVEADYATTKFTGNATQEAYNIPLVLAAESQALSWMAIRGSISHSLMGRDWSAGTTASSFAGSTSVAAGVGMTFGDVQVDGLVASNATAFSTAPGFGTGAKSDQTFGFGDSMISRIGLTYNF